MSNQVGSKMSMVVSFAAQNPGQPMLAAAEFAGPNGSRKYGYATVHRALKAGVVVRGPLANGRRGNFGLYTPEAAATLGQMDRVEGPVFAVAA